MTNPDFMGGIPDFVGGGIWPFFFSEGDPPIPPLGNPVNISGDLMLKLSLILRLSGQILGQIFGPADTPTETNI